LKAPLSFFVSGKYSASNISGHQNPSSLQINPKTHGLHQRGVHLSHRVCERPEGYVEFARKEFIGKVSVWDCESRERTKVVESMEARRKRFKRMKRLFLGGWLKGYKEWSGEIGNVLKGPAVLENWLLY
jgi:hypothetical protein